MTSARSTSLFFLSATTILGCGSRSALDGTIVASSGGSGGSGGSTTTSTAGTGGDTTTTTTPTTTEILCSLLQAQPPVIATPNGTARRPGLGNVADGSTVIFGALFDDGGTKSAQFAAITDPWSAWPPALAWLPWAPGFPVQDMAMSTGPTNALAILTLAGSNPYAMSIDAFDVSGDPFLSLGSGDALYVAGIEGVTLGAIVEDLPGNAAKLDVGSLTPNGLPQSEPPHVCVSSKVRAAAVPNGTGFVSAVAEPDDPADACDAMTPSKATRVAMLRYEAPSAPGGSLQVTEGASFSETEPIHVLAMTPATFGAWVIFQTDGSTSEQMPAIVAAPVDAKGNLLQGVVGPFPASPEGVDWPYIGAARLAGDAVAVAHMETLDPSAPAIVIQVVEPNGAKGPSITVPTNGAWPTGRIELLPSPTGLGFLVAWETNEATQDRIALARVDCIAPI